MTFSLSTASSNPAYSSIALTRPCTLSTALNTLSMVTCGEGALGYHQATLPSACHVLSQLRVCLHPVRWNVQLGVRGILHLVM
jgi:hypothetical protein